jgi:hypothetical protein
MSGADPRVGSIARAPLAVLALATAACTVTPSSTWHVSRAAPPPAGVHDSREWHTCRAFVDPTAPGPRECPEGYACTRNGCEWCGDGNGETRCRDGND